MKEEKWETTRNSEGLASAGLARYWACGDAVWSCGSDENEVPEGTGWRR